MINGANLPEDILNLNVYAPKHGMSKYSIQKLGKLQGEIDESIIIVEDFKILSEMERSGH